MASGPIQMWPAVERGTGRAVVFLHGYPLDHRMWQPQLEALSPDYQVVLVDLPGFGLAAGWPVPDTLSGFAEKLHLILAAHFPGPVVMVGHSFGGYLALELYRHSPEQFAGLVLTNTRAEPDSEEARAKRMATIERLEGPSPSLDVEATTRSLLSPTTWTAGGATVDGVRSMVREAQPAAVIPTLRAIAGRPDLSPILSSITVPTLVVWGEDDQLIPPAQTEGLVARISGAKGLSIPGAGHLPSLEAPDAFAGGLRTLLDRVGTT